MQTDEAVELLEQHHDLKQAQLEDLVRHLDVLDAVYDPVNGSFIVMSERSNGGIFASGMGFPEMGFIDPSPFTAWTRLEHVPELRGKQGLRTFYDMSRNDGAVRAGLRVVKTSIQGAEWYIEPASDSVIDMNIAKFVEDCLFDALDCPWEYVIEDCLRSIDYGFFTFEVVWDYDMVKEKIVLKRLIPLHPLDVQGWNYAPNGELVGLTMEPIHGTDMTLKLEIPIEKLLHITFEMEGGDLRGTSVLRSVFKHWYFKEVLYKIDAIQKERHSVGVPVIKLPVGFSPDDRTLANNLGRNLRTNERGYITCPANWEIYFAKLEGQPVDPIPSIEHHDQKIYEGILASFMGSREISEESLDTYYKSTRYVAKCIAAQVNRGIIKKLVDMNFIRKGGYPKLRTRMIGEWEDTRTMTFALRNLAGAKFITPDEPLEEYLRDLLRLPKFDPTTARDVSGGEGGMISPSENVKAPKAQGSRQKDLPPVKPPEKNAGTDRSGG